MDRFLQDQNIALYRRLRKSSTGKTERRTIFKLLAEEMGKFKMSVEIGPRNSTPPLHRTVMLRPRATH